MWKKEKKEGKKEGRKDGGGGREGRKEERKKERRKQREREEGRKKLSHKEKKKSHAYPKFHSDLVCDLNQMCAYKNQNDYKTISKDEYICSPIFPRSNRLTIADSCPSAGEIKFQF